MSDIVRFLRARLDEDEALARDQAGPLYQDYEPGTPGNSARILAEVESKRRIIAWVNQWPWRAEPPSSVDGLLELLALPYANHPDYQEAWRP